MPRKHVRVHRGPRHIHRHHRHGAPIVPPLLGGLVLGAALSSAVAPRRETRVVHIYSPEERALITARRQQEAEERRLRMEQQQAELRQRQLELKQREDLNEQKRCQDYKIHIELANKAQTLQYDSLKAEINKLPAIAEPIARFRPSDFSGIPETKFQQNNLFNAILYHPHLYINAKNDLLKCLIYNQNYIQFYFRLFQNRSFNMMIIEPAYSEILINLYLNQYVNSNNNFISPENERQIWQKIFQLENAQVINLYNQLPVETKKLQLTLDWLKSKNSPDEIIDVYTMIENNYNLNRSNLMQFYKIAKQRIIEIELNQKSQPGSVPVINQNNKQRIDGFLETHRGMLSGFYSCFFSPKSFQIHKMIENNNLQEASNLFKREHVKEDNFCLSHGLKA